MGCVHLQQGHWPAIHNPLRMFHLALTEIHIVGGNFNEFPSQFTDTQLHDGIFLTIHGHVAFGIEFQFPETAFPATIHGDQDTLRPQVLVVQNFPALARLEEKHVDRKWFVPDFDKGSLLLAQLAIDAFLLEQNRTVVGDLLVNFLPGIFPPFARRAAEDAHQVVGSGQTDIVVSAVVLTREASWGVCLEFSS